MNLNPETKRDKVVISIFNLLLNNLASKSYRKSFTTCIGLGLSRLDELKLEQERKTSLLEAEALITPRKKYPSYSNPSLSTRMLNAINSLIVVMDDAEYNYTVFLNYAFSILEDGNGLTKSEAVFAFQTALEDNVIEYLPGNDKYIRLKQNTTSKPPELLANLATPLLSHLQHDKYKLCMYDDSALAFLQKNSRVSAEEAKEILNHLHKTHVIKYVETNLRYICLTKVNPDYPIKYSSAVNQGDKN